MVTAPRALFIPGRRSSLIGPTKTGSRRHFGLLGYDQAGCVLLQYLPRTLPDIGQTLAHAETRFLPITWVKERL